MSRKCMITRAISSMCVDCLCVDTTTEESKHIGIVIPHIIRDEKALEKACRKAVETETIKFVSVFKVETTKGLYGITEEEFMAVAKPLDDSRKPIPTAVHE